MSETIRVRACMAVVEAGTLLLVPHYQTDAGVDVQWNLPGGRVELLEALCDGDFFLTSRLRLSTS